jgi:glycosyltransferase involved in cell wall biosynthesis
MKVSVIIRTYNRAYIVAEAIESALNQTYGDYEVLVVDDGSTDNTPEVVQGFKDPKLRCIRHERNRGVGAACNTGVAQAQGELIAFLDSDDLWKPEKLERQVACMVRHPEVDAVFSDVEIIEETTTIPSLIALMRSFSKLLAKDRKQQEYVFSARQLYLCLLEEVPIKPTVLLVKREIFQKVGLFDLTALGCEDWEFLLRLAYMACFGYVDAPLAIQRRTPDAIHHKYWQQDRAFLISLFRREKVALKEDQEAIAAVNRGISTHCTNLGGSYLESGLKAKSISVYLLGFKETGEPMMLIRAASALVPIGVRHLVKGAVRRSLQHSPDRVI